MQTTAQTTPHNQPQDSVISASKPASHLVSDNYSNVYESPQERILAFFSAGYYFAVYGIAKASSGINLHP